MNKFLTFQGQQPLYLGDVDFASQAIRDAFKMVLQGLTGSDSANAIINGVVASVRYGSGISWSSGVVCIDGEILPVAASTEAGSLSDVWYLEILSEYSGTRTFKDGESHSCLETRTVKVTRQETAYPISGFRRLQGGFGSQVWTDNSGWTFRLVKTGQVWLVTLRRPAMTQSDDHFLSVSLPGIPDDDLAVFPETETTIPTTAYIDTAGGLTSAILSVKYYRQSGNLNIVMDLESGSAAGTSYVQVVLPVF